MFLQNKYSRWYHSIIQHRCLNPYTGYVEKHHIIPVSLGGSNKRDNIVSLSAREHWVCHQLLTRMTSNNDRLKMLHVCLLFKRTAKNSKRFQQLKEARSAAMKGKKHSIETRKKMSLAQRGKPKNPDSVKKVADSKRGQKLSEITRQKMSQSHIGKSHNEETKIKIGQSNRKKKKPCSQEQREKLSQINTGKKKPENFGVKIKIARSFTLVIEDPYGIIHKITYDKDSWAKQHNLRLNTLIEKGKKNERYKGYLLLEIIRSQL